MEARPDVLFVSGEALWPSCHGGRIRSARIVEALARRLAVRVLAPIEGPPPPGILLDGLPAEPALGRLAVVTSPAPRLGPALLGPRRARALLDIVGRHDPRTVMFAPAYLGAVAPDLGVPVAVDFHDLEVRRMRSLARHGSLRSRAAYSLEALKALRWEPRLARRASVSTATQEDDVARLTGWGASALLVPNGADRHEPGRSATDGPVTFVAGFGYGPNRDAARFLLDSVWPLLRRAEPEIALRLVGRQAERALAGAGRASGVEVVSDPVSVDRYYHEASIVLAPVDAGGGAQLKVTEALARGRVVVATPFSARAAPDAVGAGLVVARGAVEFADCVLRLWRDAAERRVHEQALADRRPVPTWEQACAPLVEALAQLVPLR
jgi:hypothetical protein